MPSGYFTDKAREIFRKAGADPDLSGHLAAWAEAARAIGDSRRGVVVAEDGEIMAQTRHNPATPSTPGAAYVVPEDSKRWELFGNEVSMATGQITRKSGKRVIHVKYSEVCQGAGSRRMGRPPKHDEPLVPVTLRLPESVHRTVTEAARAAGRSVNDELIARISAGS